MINYQFSIEIQNIFHEGQENFFKINCIYSRGGIRIPGSLFKIHLYPGAKNSLSTLYLVYLF